MEISPPPDSVDVQNFQFKFQNKIQIFDASDFIPSGPCCLIAVASNYGLLFVASPLETLLVFNLKDIVEHKQDNCQFRPVTLPTVPSFLAVNCNHEVLAIALCTIVVFYDVKSFSAEEPVIIQAIRLSSDPGVAVTSIQWNPCIPKVVALCTSNGNLSVYELKPSSVVLQTIQSQARCLCWSPKGKQLVTGNLDGTLSQYKPDLTLVKNVIAPKIFSNQFQCVAIHWITNYQFAVVYSDFIDLDSRPCVTIVNTPKGGAVSCVNYEDICYSSGNKLPVYYYLLSLANWGVILTSSSNSIEVGVLGSNEQAIWQQWNMNDESRAELPLTKNKQESYPIGLAFDTAAIHQLTFGENEVLPHMPLLHVLSHTGSLVTFNIINSNPAAPNVCAPPNYIIMPNHLMKSLVEIPQEDTVEVINASALSTATLPTEPKDLSLFQQPVMSSTPVMPKPISPFGLGLSASKPEAANNLFGSKLQHMQPMLKDSSAALSTPVTTVSFEQKHMPATGNIQLMQSQKERIKIPQSIHKPVDNYNSMKPIDDAPTKQSPLENLSKPVKPQPVNNSAKQDALRRMLLKEANDFQSDVYKNLIETRKVDTKVGNEGDIEEINKRLKDLKLELLSINDLTDLKSQVDDLKRDILQALSVIAEAKAQPNTQELHQIANLDPVSAKQQVSIKRLLYYVEGQVRLANQVLDQQWEAFQADCKNKLKITGSDKMINPSLETVYQPLVRQQEILSRQRSVLAALKQTIEATGVSVEHKSHGTLLKSKFLDKSDQTLSKLAKNILNMSLEPTDILTLKYKTVCENYAKLTPSKLNELRDKFTNHRTIRIKPVKVEILPQDDIVLNSKQSYENTLKNEDNLPERVFEVSKEDSCLKLDSKIKAHTHPEPNKAEAINQEIKVTGISSTYSDYINSQVSPHSFIGKTICSPMGISKPIPSAPQPVYTQFHEDKPKVLNKSEQLTSDIQKFSAETSANKPTLAMQAIHVTQQISKPLLPKISCATTLPSTAFQSDLPKHSIQPKSAVFSALSPPEGDKLSKSTASIPIINPIATTTSMKIVNQDTLINNQSRSVTIPSSPTLLPSSNAKLGTQFSANASSAFIVPIPKSSMSTSGSIFSSLTFAENSSKSTLETPRTRSITQTLEEPTKLTSLSTQSGFSIIPVLPQPVSENTVESQKPVVSSQQPSITAVSKEMISSSTDVSKESKSPSGLVCPPVVSKVDKNIDPVNIFSNALRQSTSTTVGNAPSNTSLPSTTITETTVASIFGSKTPVTATSIFGSTSTQNPKSLFGDDLKKETSSSSSVFGSLAFGTSSDLAKTTSATPASKTSNIAPNSSTTTSLIETLDLKSDNVSTPAPLFSQPAISSTNVTSIFGVSKNITTTATSIFGTALKTPDNTGSLFDTKINTETTTSTFGTSTSTATTFTSIFGTPTKTDSSVASIFSTPVTTVSIATTAAPLFATPPSSAESIFGSSPNTAVTSSSIFGIPSSTSSTSDMGNNANTIANLFGSASISISVTSSMNTFGSSGGSIFSSKPTFGDTPTFGQSSGSIFGSSNGSSPFGQKSIFGNSESNVGFGSFSTPTTQANIFGAPTASAFANTGSIFGSPQPQVFGSTQTGGSTFGGGSVFGTKPAFGQSPTFGSTLSSGGFGSFSANNDQSVSQTGFGSPSAFQKPQGGFGSPPSFGAPAQLSSGFGSSPTFGSAPVFGSGSPVKPFGSPNQPSVGGFGSPTQQSSTFENLASQNTLTFGNLAQQTGQIPSQTGFQTSPSFSGWRG